MDSVQPEVLQRFYQQLPPLDVGSSPVCPVHLRVFEELDSTNRYLWQWFRDDRSYGALNSITESSHHATGEAIEDPRKTAVDRSLDDGLDPGCNHAGEPVGDIYRVAIAATQTAGRGQWGRTWRSSLGGLYLSLGWYWPCSPLTVSSSPGEGSRNVRSDGSTLNALNDRQTLPLGAAWAVATALRRWNLPVQVKWPNDLVLAGRKLGGILVESRSLGVRVSQGGQSPYPIVLGLGLNWSNHPPDPGISLMEFYQSSPSPPPQAIQSLEHLGAIVLQALVHLGHTWPQQHHQPTWIHQYQALWIHQNQWITHNGEMRQIIGITPQGHLRATGEQGEIHLQPGEIALGY